MAAKTFSRQNLDFTLFDVLNITALNQHAYFKAHDAETIGFTLDAATDIAEKIMKPAFVDSDKNQPELTEGVVKVHQGVHDFVKTFSESGFIAAPFSNEWAGMQLPKTIAAAAEFIMGSAHNSFVMYTDLTKGAANLIYTFGTDAQKQQFLPKMLSGEWLGTMCLTETQAGSALSDVATTATPQADGTYKIKGQKIFISAGDQDITDNIIHLVLARIDGAPKGTKGISLFIVPKNRITENETQNTINDVTSIGIYHKMGQKATPAMHLEFGSKDACIGYLLGEANRGLPQMFLMMNGARLGVGMGGIHIASAAYYAALQYAQERPQGRRLNEKSALGEPTTIIHHPDVRRMLFLQKAIVEGGLSFILQCYKYLDLEKASKDTPSVAKQYNDLLELLTPVAKTYGAEMGFVAANQGLQVLGGYGYTEDFELEQLVRDCRIMSLYEGTTGIQAQALLGRQVVGNQGKSLVAWYNEVGKDVFEAQNDTILKPYWKKLMAEMRQLQKVTNHLFKLANKGNMEIFLADANLYMEAFGILNVAWQWLKHGMAAQKALSEGNNDVFYAAKIETMQFYYHYEIPRLKGLFTRLMDKTVLTVFDEKKEVLI
jgi:alkylation response protein AidB-like acyl-CoA dehydrogenase